MPLTIPQKSISNDTSRFRVVVAGRRFGKSYLSMNEIAKFSRFPNKKIYYVAPTYRQAKTIIWDDLKQKLTKVRWAKKINESDLSITLVNNSKIYLRSADAYDSLRGISIDFLVVDEAAMIEQRAWTEVLRPALSDRQGHALFITTPKGMNWVYDLYQGAKMYDDWNAHSYTTLEGGNVPAEEVEAARRELDEKTFKQEYEATFETYAGLIYYNFDADRNVKPLQQEITERTLIHAALDFNVSPMSCALATVNGNNIHIFDEIVMESSNTYELAEEIQNRYPNNRVWVYPDASGQARKTSSNTSDHNILRQAGFTLKVGRINPPVRDRIAAMNASLFSSSGEVKLLIAAKCKNVISCMSKQIYKEGTLIPDKDSGYDHMNDAVGYMVNTINPITRPQPERKGPELFGHF